MKNHIRRQLTLFLQDNFEAIEAVRQKFNPEQFKLINAHVTLCREDEIENLEQVLKNFSSSKLQAITIEFGKPTRFDNGKGVFLKAHSNIQEFHSLRKTILQGIIDEPRIQEPHITLMHPRNSTCTDSIFEQLKTINFPNQLIFTAISLIEQKEGERWNKLQEFKLS